MAIIKGRSLITRNIEELDLRDAIRMAMERPGFARKLVENPEQYRRTFNLTDEHIVALQAIKVEEFAELAKRAPDPVAFADAVSAVETFLRTGTRAGQDAVYSDQQQQ